MKYCKICKTTAKETETVCAEGHPLSVFGSSSKASPTSAPAGDTATKPVAEKPTATMFTLLGEVEKLEETKKKNIVRGRAFGLLSLAAAIAIMLLMYQVYARTVLVYAVLENVRIEQDPDMDWTIHVSYDVKSPGKLAFDRRSGLRRTEKVDVTTSTGPDGFSWTWPSDPKAGIDFSVLYRGGWLRASDERHFDVTTAGPGAALPGPAGNDDERCLITYHFSEMRQRSHFEPLGFDDWMIHGLRVAEIQPEKVAPSPSGRARRVPAGAGRRRL
jgi:hypothetical protein